MNFELNEEGLSALLQQVGQDYGSRYVAVDQQVRAEADGLSEEEILKRLRERLRAAGLAEVSDMPAWARAIHGGEDFKIEVSVG